MLLLGYVRYVFDCWMWVFWDCGWFCVLGSWFCCCLLMWLVCWLWVSGWFLCCFWLFWWSLCCGWFLLVLWCGWVCCFMRWVFICLSWVYDIWGVLGGLGCGWSWLGLCFLGIVCCDWWGGWDCFWCGWCLVVYFLCCFWGCILGCCNLLNSKDRCCVFWWCVLVCIVGFWLVFWMEKSLLG